MKKLIALLAVLVPLVSIAHPGHGVAENNGFVHLLISHGVLVGLIVVAGVASYFWVRKTTNK